MYICQISCYDILTKSQSSLSDKESYPKELEDGREGLLDLNISLANQEFKEEANENTLIISIS